MLWIARNFEITKLVSRVRSDVYLAVLWSTFYVGVFTIFYRFYKIYIIFEILEILYNNQNIIYTLLRLFIFKELHACFQLNGNWQ